MAEFPSMEEFTQKVAERALDEFTYSGKTIREWVRLIATTADEIGFNIGAAVDNLRCDDVVCAYCDDHFEDGCARNCADTCEQRRAARYGADLLELLYADNCAKRAEMELLTNSRDEWKRRAEAAEQALNILKNNTISVETCDKYYSCGSDNTYEYQRVAQWAIIRDIMNRIEERKAVQYTTRRIDEYTVEMRGTLKVLIEPPCDQEEKEAEP